MSVWILSGSGSWLSGANWNQGIPNGIGAVAQFAITAPTTSVAIDILDGSTITVSTIDVTQSSIANLLIRSSGVGNLVFDAINGMAQVNVNNTAQTGYFAITPGFDTRVWLNSYVQFNLIDPTSLARVSAPIFGTGGIVKIGAGTLSLEGSNTFLSGIQLNAGTLVASSGASLGQNEIRISNNALLVTSGTVGNALSTLNGATGLAGFAKIAGLTGTTLTLTGVLSHLSRETLAFGTATDTGTIVASFTSILDNVISSKYDIAGGTLRFGNTLSAAQLFARPGTGLTGIAGTLDTAGFATSISNLDLNGGTISASTGVLNLTLSETVLGPTPQAGTISGTAGIDSLTANVNNQLSLAGVTFANWTAGVDLITLNGSANANTITGSAGRDAINGLDGNDVLYSGGGIDLIDGGNGVDTIILTGASSGSTIIGGGGSDILSVTSGSVSLASIAGFELIEVLAGAQLQLTAAQLASGFASASTLAGAGTVFVTMASGEIVFLTGYGIIDGTTLSFNITGSSGVDVIKCALGVANSINGAGSTDQIRTGNLADTINGGDGDDKIMGLGGADLLTGGLGADQFRFLFTSDSLTGGGADQILDFVAGTDKLDFRALDANPNLAGRQLLSYIGTGAFVANGVGQVRWVDLGADHRIEIDYDGNGTIDSHILLVGAGAQTLTGTDFLL